MGVPLQHRTSPLQNPTLTVVGGSQVILSLPPRYVASTIQESTSGSPAEPLARMLRLTRTTALSDVVGRKQQKTRVLTKVLLERGDWSFLVCPSNLTMRAAFFTPNQAKQKHGWGSWQSIQPDRYCNRSRSEFLSLLCLVFRLIGHVAIAFGIVSDG
jgi:hypothetical protein